MKKIVAVLSDPTTEGSIINVPSTQTTLNGVPISTLGSKLVYKGSPNDTPVEFVNGILLNNRPLTFAGASTASGAKIVTSGITTAYIEGPSYLGSPGSSTPAEATKSIKVELQSRFALTQLEMFAAELSEANFKYSLGFIFNKKIRLYQFAFLYQALKEKKASNYNIEVLKGVGGNTGYNYITQTIELEEHTVVNAATATDEMEKTKALVDLFQLLVNEFGHHVDYLLRNVYKRNTTGKEKLTTGVDIGDVYSYFLTNYNPFEDTELYFADAVIDGQSYPLKLDVSEFQQELSQRISQANAADDDDGTRKFYGAGEGEPEMGYYGHYGLEKEVFRQELGIDQSSLNFVYLGNYMRDMSQLCTPNFQRPTAAQRAKMDSAAYKGMATLGWPDSYKPTREALTFIVELLASQETMNHSLKTKDTLEGTGNKAIENADPSAFSEKMNTISKYLGYALKGVKFAANYEGFLAWYGGFNAAELGVYRPEEHIDNPIMAGVADFEKGDYFWCPEGSDPEINTFHGMKKYIKNYPDGAATKEPHYRGEGKYAGGALPTAATYIKEQLQLCYQKYRSAGTEHLRKRALMHLGNALHTLEDYFAHSNFVELSLTKMGYFAHLWTDPFPNGERHEPVDQSMTGAYKVNRTSLKEPIEETKLEGRFKGFKKGKALYMPGTMEDPVDEEGFQFSAKDFEDPKKETVYIFMKPVNSATGMGQVWKAGERISKTNTNDNVILYYPVVTGYFGPNDLIFSVSDKLKDVFKPEELGFWELFSSNSGAPATGTDTEKLLLEVQDLLILFCLKGLEESQDVEKVFRKEIHVGKAASDLIAFYKKYMEYRQYLYAVLELWRKTPYGAIIAKILQMSLNFVEKSMKKMVYEGIQKLLINQMLSIVNEQNKGKYGTNPSHSQLAKDSRLHPLHELSALMAKQAIKDIGGGMFYLLDFHRRNQLQLDKVPIKYFNIDNLMKSADLYLSHPADVSWMEAIIEDWIIGTPKSKNKYDDDNPSNADRVIEQSKGDTYHEEHEHKNAADLERQAREMIDHVAEEMKEAYKRVEQEWENIKRKYGEVTDKAIRELKEFILKNAKKVWENENVKKLKKALEEAEEISREKMQEIIDWIGEQNEYFKISGIEKYSTEDVTTIANFYVYLDNVDNQRDFYLNQDPRTLIAMQTGIDVNSKDSSRMLA